MAQTNSVSKPRVNARFLILTLAAVALWVTLPFMLQLGSTASASEADAGSALVANLSGSPIASVTPHGTGYYTTNNSANAVTHQLYVEVSSVNLPAQTQLGVFLNTANIGTITLDAARHGTLFLPATPGGAVPTVVAGDTLTVKNGTATILTGTFAAAPTPTPTATPTGTPTGTPTHTPTPSVTPTGTPLPVTRLFATLTGPAIDGMVPRGLAEYEAQGTGREIEVYVSNVNLPEGTVLTVATGTGTPAATDAAIGTITLHNHAGCLHSETNVPVITTGTALTVKNGTTTVLSGTFTNTPPTPGPTPSRTPTPSPSPSGTPVPIRVFAARLNGSSEVPPVTTEGRGAGYIMLNDAETQISVRLYAAHLSSAATAMTINGPAAATANGPVIFTLALPSASPSPGSTPPPAQTFNVTTQQVAQLRNGTWYFQVATSGHTTGEIRGNIHSINSRADFDGDGVTDISVVRPVNGLAPDNAANDWYILNSSNGTVSQQSIGHPGDVNVPGDYDGDGIADIAMFTPSDGTWQIRGSSTGQTLNFHWGQSGDIPVVGDYDGDGINDLAVFRPSDGNWYIRHSTDGSVQITHWGAAGDRPVSGDFDGDGNNDIAIFRPSTGDWYVNRSSDGGYTIMHWGMSGDLPVAGDFDGDGTSDIAVFRPSEGNWYIFRSSDGGYNAYHWGTNGDIPVACEYDGDGITDIGVFRPSDGNWYIYRSSNNSYTVNHFGISTDRPAPTVYTP